MDELTSQLEAIDAEEAAKRAAKTAFDAAWRRLKGLHEGLASEYASRVGNKGRRTTDPRVLLHDMEMSATAAVDRMSKDAADAEKAFAEHAASAGPFSFLSGTHRARSRILGGKAASARDALGTAERDFSFRRNGFAARAETQARENSKANDVELSSYASLLRKVDAFAVAMKAIQAGNESSVACLVRNDLDALLFASSVWNRLRQDLPVTEAEYGLYLGAKHPPFVRPAFPSPPPDPESFSHPMDASATAMTSGHFGGDAFGRSGPVVDAEWVDVPARIAIGRRKTSDDEDG